VVQVLIGPGWFGRESDGRSTWLWSRGNSAIILRSSAPNRVTLRYGMRALGKRIVTASVGDRVVWRGTIGEGMSSVEIEDIPVPAGATVLSFKTDSPGVAESPGGGGRALTYALYNPQLRAALSTARGPIPHGNGF
jgi:hypothetical protein